MAASITEDTKVSFKVPLFVTLAVALVAGGAGYAANAANVNSEVSSLGKQVQKVKAQVEVQAANEHQHDLRLQRLEDNDAHIIQLLQEVRADTKTLMRKVE